MEKKLKVLFDITFFYTGRKNNAGRTGIFFTVYNLFVHFLRRSDIEVCIYVESPYICEVFSVMNTLPEDLKSKIRVPNELLKSYNRYKFFHKNSLVLLFFKAYRKFIYEKFFKKFNKSVDVGDCDIFFSPVYSFPEYIKKSDIKKMIVLYDAIPLIFNNMYKKSGFVWFNRLIDSLNKNDYYICISDCTRQDFLKLNKIDESKTYTVYLAAGENFYLEKDSKKIWSVKKKYGIPEGAEYIYSLSSLEPRKNLIFAVNNFIEFIEKNRIENLYMVLSGAVWDIFKNKIEEQVPKYSMYKDKIIQTGYVLDEDLSSLFSGAKFFVYPSIYEGFGLPVLEAMKCGTAVITSNVSSLPEVGGDAVYYINPKDNESLIKAYEEMYYNNDMRESIKEKALKHAENFSWEISVDKIVNIMDRITSGKQHV